MAKYKVTIVKTITTNIFLEAESADAARRSVSDFGIIESAADMGTVDEVSARIVSVTQVDGI